jgi:hypothetical protein
MWGLWAGVLAPTPQVPLSIRPGPAAKGPTTNSIASDRLVVWLLVESGSRCQSWAWTVAAAGRVPPWRLFLPLPIVGWSCQGREPCPAQ